MSRTLSSKIKYDCGFDHGQGIPCDGHELYLSFCASSDTVAIMVDGENRYTMSDGQYAALAKAMGNDIVQH